MHFILKENVNKSDKVVQTLKDAELIKQFPSLTVDFFN